MARRLLRTVLQVTFWLLLVLLIVTALYVSVGRQIVPRVSEYREPINDWLSQQLDASVTSREIEGFWARFHPRFEVTDLQVQTQAETGAPEGPETTTSLAFSRVSLEPDILQSLWQQQPVIRNLTIHDLSLQLSQHDNGRWHLSGFSPGNNPPTLAELFDLARGVADVSLREATVHITSRTGESRTLRQVALDFRSDNDIYTLRLRGEQDDVELPLILEADLAGQSLETLAGDAYLSLPPGSYNDVLQSLVPALQEGRVQTQSLSAFGEFWLTLQGGSLQELTLRAGGRSDLQVSDGDSGTNDDVELNEVQIGWLQLSRNESQSGWELDAEEVGFQYNGVSWPEGGMSLRYSDQGQLDARVDVIDAGLVTRLLTAFLPGGAARAEVDGFNVRGQYQDLVFNAALNERELQSASLKANVQEGAMSAHRNAPSLWGLDGYLQFDLDMVTEQASGFFELDSQSLAVQFPDLFEDIWEYDKANGRVGFKADFSQDLQVRLSSSVISAESDQINARGQFAVDIQNGDERKIVLDLMIGALSGDASHKSQYLPTGPKAPQLAQAALSWVARSVQSGNIANSGFIFRGEVQSGSSHTDRNLQMFFHVNDGQLEFDPAWPVLENIDGYLTIRNGEVDVFANAGESLDIAFEQARATVRENPGGGQWLTVSGEGQGSAAQGLLYLQQTPVTRDVSEYLNDWQAEGETKFTLSLSLPLGIASASPDVVLDMNFENHQLYIPDFDLQAADVNGTMRYSAATGLSSNNLTANVWGREVDLAVSSDVLPVPSNVGEGEAQPSQPSTQTRLEATGMVDDASLREWSGMPDVVRTALGRAEGEFPYELSLTLGGTPELAITSELQGLSVDFPPPFQKRREESWPLQLNMTFDGAETQIQARLAELAQLNLSVETESDAETPYGGLLYLGVPSTDMRVRRLNPDEPGLDVIGHVEHLEYEAWADAIQSLPGASASVDSAQSRVESLVGSAALTIGTLDIYGEEITDLSLSVEKLPMRWNLGMVSEVIEGDIAIPTSGSEPWQVDLDHLILRADEAEQNDAEPPGLAAGLEAAAAESQAQQLALDELPTVEYELPPEDPLASFDPRIIPDMNLQIDQVNVAGADFGNWRFNVTADGSGALFRDLRMQLRGLQIGSEEEPAEFRWVYDGNTHRSALNGIILAGDLAPVLSNFGYAPSLESSEARFDTRLHWDGSPAYFSALAMSGDIDINIQDGRFRQRAGVANSALRLISFINFDALVRRLRFSDDLVRTGLSYDEISGRINLSQGIVTIEDRLQIIGAASLFQIAGQIDLANQTIDGDLYITLPVSDNIPWLSGFAVLNNLINWQLAVGVFLVDQIFGDQVDDLTSAHYKLDGPWDGLEPELNQVFSSGS